MNAIEIPEAIYEKIIDHATRDMPNEACGMLAGHSGKVQTHYEMSNSDQSGEHFTLVPQEQFQVIKAIRASGLSLLGIYHSHPASPARPSAEDIRLALTPDVVHVIVSMQTQDPPDIKGFDIENGVVTHVPLNISK
ncbi:MAG: M67 family metallopeptidase [Planctomycetes bacterium]|nr:M67 family metallopeptidase [Planctomycetota bacterium]